MHVLIIPGEQLNRKDLFSSSFELSQSRVLALFGYNVALLSVRCDSGFFPAIKFHIKRFISLFTSLSKRFDFKTINEDCLNEIRTIEVRGAKMISHSMIDGYSYIVELACRGFEYYITKYGRPDIIHGHSRFLTGGLIAHGISKRYGIPYVVTEHSSAYVLKPLSDVELELAASIINHSDACIAVSKSLGDSICRVLNHRLIKKFEVLPNVIDEAFEMNRPNFNSSNDSFVFLSVANFTENKAQKNLLKAFSIACKGNPNFKLRIAGKGEQENELRSLTDQLGISSQVEFLGFINKDKVIQELDQSDVYVLTSKYETFGVILIEALSRGIPVIATKSGGPEEIVNSSNGVLIDYNNIDQLVVQLKNIVHLLPKFDKELIRKDCISRFGSQAYFNALTPIYKRVVAS